ncbi:MAG TPA: hypothetical protein VGJ28_20895, partial [Micromonosporaceae bacterium]
TPMKMSDPFHAAWLKQPADLMITARLAGAIGHLHDPEDFRRLWPPQLFAIIAVAQTWLEEPVRRPFGNHEFSAMAWNAAPVSCRAVAAGMTPPKPVSKMVVLATLLLTGFDRPTAAEINRRAAQ